MKNVVISTSNIDDKDRDININIDICQEKNINSLSQNKDGSMQSNPGHHAFKTLWYRELFWKTFLSVCFLKECFYDLLYGDKNHVNAYKIKFSINWNNISINNNEKILWNTLTSADSIK